ncbi:MAG TPA: hypothetical protein VE782_09435, partial [Myxococcaceae bacterium]|nr:hypothetical protein [Myxococcaceae bacterium]
MRLRLLAPPALVTGVGIAVLVGLGVVDVDGDAEMKADAWPLALAAGAAAGALVAFSGAVTYAPLEARIRTLANS